MLYDDKLIIFSEKDAQDFLSAYNIIGAEVNIDNKGHKIEIHYDETELDWQTLDDGYSDYIHYDVCIEIQSVTRGEAKAYAVLHANSFRDRDRYLEYPRIKGNSLRYYSFNGGTAIA